jgi:hypothetical protein
MLCNNNNNNNNNNNRFRVQVIGSRTNTFIPYMHSYT